MRDGSPRCRPRAGMLRLLRLLPNGHPWEAPSSMHLPAAPTTSPDGRTATFPASFSFVWNIGHFDSLSCVSMYSPPFSAIGRTWRMQVYPRGNNNQSRELSVYLDSGILRDSQESVPCRFTIAVLNYKAVGDLCPCASASACLCVCDSLHLHAPSFSLPCSPCSYSHVLHALAPRSRPPPRSTAQHVTASSGDASSSGPGPINMHASVIKEAEHTFTRRAPDWGFINFMPVADLLDGHAGFLNDDSTWSPEAHTVHARSCLHPIQCTHGSMHSVGGTGAHWACGSPIVWSRQQLPLRCHDSTRAVFGVAVRTAARHAACTRPLPGPPQPIQSTHHPITPGVTAVRPRSRSPGQ